MPLNAAVSLLLSHTGFVVLGGEKLTRAEAEALDVSLSAGVILDTVRGGPDRSAG